jgi:hypothetical protein
VVDDAQIITEVCRLLAGVSLKARDLVKLLIESGIEIDKSELNSRLYRLQRSTPGLEVEMGVWRYVAPTGVKTVGRAGEGSIKNIGHYSVNVPAKETPGARRAVVATPSSGGSHGSLFEASVEQKKVIDADATQWTLVEAGPGTGKTAVALSRVARLLEQRLPPHAILMVSFTRTAVAELRQRIETLSKDVAAAGSVRITTLDAEAWNLGIGFRGGTVAERLAGGFDGNIEDAIKLFQADDPSLLEWMAQTRHVIIDEAQDLVGRRIELVFQILAHLPETCGVTIFLDPAQAIYGFSEAEEDGEDEEKATDEQFQMRLLEEFPNTFVSCKLTQLFRSSNAKLRRVFEDGRALVLSIDDADNRLRKLHELAKVQCSATELGEHRADELVLFRRRSEVLLASSMLAADGKPHRVRMSHTSLGALPWVTALFAEAQAPTMARSEFDRICTEQSDSPHVARLDRDRAWKLLLRTAANPDGTAIDLRALRRVLARPRPPAELSQTEVGMRGPIIGTIHASKGREAEVVSLMVPHQRKNSDPDRTDEEVRVAYVGATRARQELLLGKGFRGYGFRPLKRSGRVYRQVPDKLGWIQVELGLPGDVDETAIVSRKFVSANAALSAQELLHAYDGEIVPLEVRTDHERDFAYCVTTKTGIALGSLSSFVNADLFKIASELELGGRRPPEWIANVALVGVRTFAIAEDNPRLSEVHEPWATRGVWLVPVVRALTQVPLLMRKFR